MLSGRISGDPTFTTGRDQMKSAVFTVKTNHVYRGADGEKYSEDEKHVVRLKRATTIAKYLHDNKSVVIIGRLMYTNSDAYILAETVHFPG